MIRIADQVFETLKAAFDWCVENGSENDWDVLGMEYFNRLYGLNALFCFRKADEIRMEKLKAKFDIGKLEYDLQYLGSFPS